MLSREHHMKPNTPRNVKGPNTKSLDPRIQAHVRGMLEEIVARDFNGNVSACARAFKMAQSTVYEILAKTRGPGMKVISAIANYKRVTVDQVLGHSVRPMEKDRYPNRAEAVAIARELGYNAQAIVEIKTVRLDSGTGEDVDMPVRLWLERIQSRSRELAELHISKLSK